MKKTVKTAAKPPLKPASDVIDFTDRVYKTQHIERRKADMQWQMNLAKKMLHELKTDTPQAQESFQSFHKTASKRLWHLRRQRSA